MVAFGTGYPSLNGVVQSLTHELDQIESVFYATTGMNTVGEYVIRYSPAEDGCLVSLWDAWNRFIRRLLLACSAGGVEGLSGAAYVPVVARNETAALAHISANVKATKIRIVQGEPYWFDVTAIADFTSVLGLTNAAVIDSAIMASSVQLGPFTVRNPLEEIRLCRNFVAHKNDGTLSQMAAYIGAGFTDLCTHVRSKAFGVERFSDWKEACRTIAIAASQ